MKLRFTGFDHTATYAGGPGRQSRWPAGEVREVSEEEARYLRSTFPGAFAEVVTEPVKHRAILGGPRHRPMPDPLCPEVLNQSIPDLRDELETGKHDSILDDLRAAEVSGKTRRGALAAIDERRAALDPDGG